MQQSDLKARIMRGLTASSVTLLGLAALWRSPSESAESHVKGNWSTQADGSSQHLDFEATWDKLVPGRPPNWLQMQGRA